MLKTGRTPDDAKAALASAKGIIAKAIAALSQGARSAAGGCVMRVFAVAAVLAAVAAALPSVPAAQSAWQQAPPRPLRIIAFGAHPDDAELKASGVAALWAAAGHKVKFVAMTNGDVGHFESAGGPLAKRRQAEVAECAKILGIETEVLDIHDGELMPSLENRRTVARLIRDWQADIVMGHRPYDYHPDHRYTGVLMDDAAVVVVAPFFVPDTKPTPRNPVFMYYSDGFQDPKPFTPSMVVGHRRGRRQEVEVHRRDAVAVRRQGLLAGADAAQRAAGRRRAGGLPARHREEAQHRGGRPVSRSARLRCTARSAAGRSGTPRRSSWGSTDGRRRRTN